MSQICFGYCFGATLGVEVFGVLFGFSRRGSKISNCSVAYPVVTCLVQGCMQHSTIPPLLGENNTHINKTRRIPKPHPHPLPTRKLTNKYHSALQPIK